MTTALIDGDIVLYRSAASCEPTKTKPIREPLDVAIQRCDELLYRILEQTGSDQYKIFISGSENFRKTIDPTYKANRPLEKPEHFHGVRNFLISEWGAEITGGYEADDAIGIASQTLEDTVICSIDKDFLQLPGKHFNFVKNEFLDVSYEEAEFNFWCQMLIGDTSDNVVGIEGIGKKKAPRRLEGLTPDEMFDVVLRLYGDKERFYKNKTLLHLLRSEDEWASIQEYFLSDPTVSKSQGEETTTTD